MREIVNFHLEGMIAVLNSYKPLETDDTRLRTVEIDKILKVINSVASSFSQMLAHNGAIVGANTEKDFLIEVQELPKFIEFKASVSTIRTILLKHALDVLGPIAEEALKKDLTFILRNILGR